MKVKFTEEQAAMLNALPNNDREQINRVWVEDQIKWRTELIERYTAEIDALKASIA